MARKVLSDTYYSFTPSSRTIVFNQFIQRERFVLITNLNTNQVIYNFSDPNLKITSYSMSTNNVTGSATTTVVLQYNTASMSATDDLQVVIDEYDEKFTPSELYTDPVNKFRVSQPQALIDTDFEYSTQSTKWETLSLVNNRPYAYQNTVSNTIISVGGPLVVTAIAVNSNSNIVTVYTANTPIVNTPIFITDTAWAPSEGTFMVDSVTPGHAIRYVTKQRYINTAAGVANVNINIPGVTAVANGSVFTRANIGIANINFISTFANGQITTTQPHGLSLGNEVVIQGAFAATSGTPNGTYTITGVYSNTTFRIDANVAPVSATGITSTLANLFSSGRSTVVHRAYDGGVEFGTAAEGHNNQLIRQTRRYFRYQSGKGIQMSTGTLLKPAMRVDSITSSGVVVTVRTKEAHFLDANVSINVVNCDQSAYNGTFNVRETLDPYTFTYVANSTPSSSTATGLYRINVNNWFGAINRVGMFDDQNGLFFEYDGTTLSAIRRSSSRQLSGYISANTSNTQIDGVLTNGVTTKFSTELEVGDFIVIKGMSYRVIEIQSDTRLHVSPAYRGETPLFQAVANKTIDYRYPQSSWNLDRCDGTGPSGFNIDLGRMQMFYLDYSWYGAGFVRWGFRGQDGNILYCHKVVNNNVNYEAYMRSGNLPARYETNTFSRRTRLQASLASGDSTMNVSNASTFPTAGTLWVYGGPGGLSEFINYNGVSNNSPSGWTLNNLTRGQPGATINCVMSTTSTVINLVAGQATTGIQPGMYVSSANIPGTAIITSVTPGVSIQLSQAPQIAGTGLVTFIPMGNTAQTFTFSSASPTSVELHAPGYSPRISHWGTSVIMDGRYDDDKSFVFTQGMSIPRSVPPGQRMALQSFRIAPSVSNGVPGNRLGEREIINRMQMVLRQLDLLSGGQMLMEIVLNGSVANATPTWASVGGSSLVQYVNHGSDTRIENGEIIYGFFTNSSGGTTNLTTTSMDLPLVRDLGNSILGGGTADPNRGFYPDGPDIITICARNVGTAAASIYSRLSWTEAQA
jgi:hypothetical protein